MISKNIRQAYSEVDEFLSLLSEHERNKIPENLREIFRQEKDKDYIKGINPSIEIKDQNLLEETLAIIAMLNLNYICEDEEEKARLREVYANNEKKYQDIFQVDFNADEVFGTKDEYFTQKLEEQIIVPVKENIFEKIINKIKRIFRR